MLKKPKTFHLSTEALYRSIVQSYVLIEALLTILKSRIHVI
jgi:hypothetical protein